MRLVAIGECFKNIDKLSSNKLLEAYSDILWKQVKGVRDILSHHYLDLDVEVIINICKSEIDRLLNTTIQIIKE